MLFKISVGRRKFLRFLVKIEGFGDRLGPISRPAVPLVSTLLASGEKLGSGKSITARQDLDISLPQLNYTGIRPLRT